MADRDSGNRDIWLVNSTDGNLSRLTSHPANDWHPAWSPDGAEIAFASDRSGPSTVYRRASNGAATETLIPTTGMPGNVFPDEWSRKDGMLAVHVSTPATLLDVWVLSLTPSGRSYPVAQTRFQELSPSFSPDGRWIAFVSDESGTPEVYVQRLGQGGSQKVSTAGGRFVKWRSDGRELFFVDAANRFVAVAVDASDRFVPATPVHLFDACLSPVGGADQAPYDVTVDGSRSLWLCPTPPRVPSLVNVFVGWTNLADKRH